jgi:LPXTG-motif cell wall-anchored protein
MGNERIPAPRNFQVSEEVRLERKRSGVVQWADGSRGRQTNMGVRDPWLGRAFSRTLLLLFVALVAAVGGALPADPAGAAKKAPPGDPPGNNGTVKIKQDDPPEDNTLDTPNEPHGTDCRIWLAFFGFDEGQKAIITFTGQAPSAPSDTPVLEDKGADGKGVDISSDPAAGGKNDPEPAYVPVDLAQAVKDAGLEEHPQQGYHLKLTTSINDKDGNAVPGGVKHKVFWLAPCSESTIPPPTGTAAGTGGNPGTSVGGADTATNPGTFVLGATETAPEAAATLPRTGADSLALTATGLWALAAGGALLAGSRRRRA